MISKIPPLHQRRMTGSEVSNMAYEFRLLKEHPLPIHEQILEQLT